MSADGKLGSELGRRIGEATAAFKTLRALWSHSSIGLPRKLHVFDACVVSRLAYGLQSACLNKAARNRLDGFQARCLRQILRIPSSYISRITNATVVERAQALKVSSRILQQQMLYFGGVARRSSDDPVRAAIFQPGSSETVPPPNNRKRGRPRMSWTPAIRTECLRAVGTHERLSALLQPTPQAGRAWRGAVCKYVHSLQ